MPARVIRNWPFGYLQTQIRRAALALAAIVLTSCSSLPALPTNSKLSAAELGVAWHSRGFPVSLQRFLDDRNKCLMAAHQTAGGHGARSDPKVTDAFAECFRAAGYEPDEPRKLLSP
jgi:hypothetical protein